MNKETAHAVAARLNSTLPDGSLAIVVPTWAKPGEYTVTLTKDGTTTAAILDAIIPDEPNCGQH